MPTKQIASIIIILVISLALASCAPAKPAEPVNTPAPAATSTPDVPTFSKETGLEISNSDVTGEGQISFEQGTKPGLFKITINGKMPVVDPKTTCMFCMNTIHIAPGLSVPVEFMGVFELDTTTKVLGGSVNQNLKIVQVNGVNTIKNPPEVESITYEAVVLEYPEPAASKNAIVTGSEGATLRKDGKLLFLVTGAAHLLKR